MNSSLKGKQIGSIDNFELLLTEVSAFFKSSNLTPAQFCKHVDGALKQFEFEEKTIHLKPAGVVKRQGERNKSLLNKKTSWRLEIAVAAFLLTSCLIIAGLPVFYDSSNDTLVSKFLNDPYVQAVLPKEYSYQLGVFYMNLRFKLARLVRSFVVYMGTLHIFGSLGSRGNAMETDKQCFFINPIFPKPAESCSLCERTEEVIFHPNQPYENKEDFLDNIFLDGNIHVFEKSGLDTSLHVLQQHVSSNLQAIELEQHNFMSNIDYVTSVKDLGKKHVISKLFYHMPSNGHIVWSTEHYTMSRLMRQVFPRPSSIPYFVAIAHSKAILLDGATAPEYRLPVDKKMHVLYIQGFGSRKIRLLPPDGCVVKCSTHTVTTETSDVLIFDAEAWTAYSIPNGYQPSFAYVTYVTIEIDEDL